MADTSVAQKPGGQLTWVWAAAAIVAIIALMAWLASTRDLVTTTPVETEAVDTVDVAGAGTGMEATDLSLIGATPDQYVGQDVRVENVPVAAVLGNRGFWAEIPGANPFLMVVDPGVTDVSWVAAGDTVSLQGTVQAVTEEGVAGWVEGEMIREGAAAEASFATHYLEITSAEP